MGCVELLELLPMLPYSGFNSHTVAMVSCVFFFNETPSQSWTRFHDKIGFLCDRKSWKPWKSICKLQVNIWPLNSIRYPIPQTPSLRLALDPHGSVAAMVDLRQLEVVKSPGKIMTIWSSGQADPQIISGIMSDPWNLSDHQSSFLVLNDIMSNLD